LEIRKLENNKKKLEQGSFAMSNLQDRLQELVRVLEEIFLSREGADVPTHQGQERNDTNFGT